MHPHAACEDTNQTPEKRDLGAPRLRHDRTQRMGFGQTPYRRGPSKIEKRLGGSGRLPRQNDQGQRSKRRRCSQPLVRSGASIATLVASFSTRADPMRRDLPGIKMCLPKRRKACAENSVYCRAISRQNVCGCLDVFHFDPCHLRNPSNQLPSCAPIQSIFHTSIMARSHSSFFLPVQMILGCSSEKSHLISSA